MALLRGLGVPAFSGRSRFVCVGSQKGFCLFLFLFCCPGVSTLAGSSAHTFADGAGTAAAFNYPYGVAVDAFGNVLVADQGNNRLRRVTPSGGTRLADGGKGEGDGSVLLLVFFSPYLCFVSFLLCSR